MIEQPSTDARVSRTRSLTAPSDRPEPWSGAPWTPRKWQAAALTPVLDTLETGKRAIVSAVMGSGKSILITEVVHQHLGRDVIVVTTPTQALVDQLAGTLSQRIGTEHVGRYFTHAKEADRPVVVACNASAPAVAEALAAQGRRVGLWIADEVHRTETVQMLHAARALQPVAQLGFTATPFRSQDHERLRMWDEVAFRYSLADALHDEVLVPWTVIPWDGEGADDLDSVCLELIRLHASGPGMVNAADIGDAEAFAELLRGYGIDADTVHSRRSADDNAAAIAALEAGDLACIVHVNMLAEGVDLPWLRWLCLRRPVSARVRFIQEVGRVLRASPGKDRAVLMDPHDLFGAFGWDLAEALGEWEEVHGEPRGPQEERSPSTMRSPTATDEWTAYCRRLLLPLQAAGWAASQSIASCVWRRELPTDKQMRYLQVCRSWRPWTWLPGDHAQQVANLLSHPGHLTRGAVSDLITVSKVVSQRRAYPVDADVVDLPSQGVTAGLTRGRAAGNGDPRWYVAGVWLKDQPEVAVVVFHGGRVAGSWSMRRRPDSDWTALQITAIRAGLYLASQQGSGPFVLVTSLTLAAAVANREASPRKRPIREAMRELDARFGGLHHRVEVVEANDNPASLYAFRKLRRQPEATPPEAM
ncbi:DEAD/DEAH box helicase family protein [bacterium]|nr:DEAD/DEAH box helicase family protein [bacterium]